MLQIRPESDFEPRIAPWNPLFSEHYSRKRVGKVFCDVVSYRKYQLGFGSPNSPSRKLHFTSLTSNSNKGSIWSYRMYRDIVFVYLQKAVDAHLFGKALLLSSVEKFQRKDERCLTTEWLSQRQESDISGTFDIIPSELCPWSRIVEVCGLHTIKFFSMAIPILTNQPAYARYPDR